MNDTEFLAYVTELNTLKDNKAVASYLATRDSLTTTQRLIIVETFLIACINKIAKLEHVTNSKNMG